MIIRRTFKTFTFFHILSANKSGEAVNAGSQSSRLGDEEVMGVAAIVIVPVFSLFENCYSQATPCIKFSSPISQSILESLSSSCKFQVSRRRTGRLKIKDMSIHHCLLYKTKEKRFPLCNPSLYK
jgi:hypothetical protein